MTGETCFQHVLLWDPGNVPGYRFSPTVASDSFQTPWFLFVHWSFSSLSLLHPWQLEQARKVWSSLQKRRKNLELLLQDLACCKWSCRENSRFFLFLILWANLFFSRSTWLTYLQVQRNHCGCRYVGIILLITLILLFSFADRFQLSLF